MSHRKHILFVTEFFHPDICASATVAADHLPRIAALRPDLDVTVIASNRAWHDPAAVYPSAETFQGVQVIRVDRPAVGRRGLLRRALGFAAFQRRAVKAARRLAKLDLVIGTTAPPQGAVIAQRIARRHDCPYVYKVYDLYPDLAAALGKVSDGSFLYRRWLASDTRAMRDAARVVSISENITDRIAATRDIPVEKLRTIHDGFDPARLEAPPAGPTFRQQHNPDGKFVVQYAGNMGLSHPFDAIMSACGTLSDEPDILFQFIGDGPQRAYVRRHLPKTGQLLDYQPAERLGELLATADVCLISQHEDMHAMALPYKLYAILAAAKPAIFIGSAAAETGRLLTQHGAGLQVDPNDANGLIETIRSLRRDPEKATSMGRAGRRLLDEKLHVRTAANQWAELIDDVLSQ